MDHLSVAQYTSPQVGDYIQLTKPRVMILVIFTAAISGMLVNHNQHPFLFFTMLLAISMGAGAAGAMNMAYEADIDSQMSRTRLRPIPAGRMTPAQALAFSAGLGLLSIILIGLATRPAAAIALGGTILFYGQFYTRYLKRKTPQNIVIGGIAGALPTVIADIGATGSIHTVSVLLSLVIFLWTPPHFWALALYRLPDYKNSQLPMHPVVYGPAATQGAIGLYSIALMAVVQIIPFYIGDSALQVRAMLIALIPLQGFYMHAAWQVYAASFEDEAHPPRNGKIFLYLFKISILYLFGVFCVYSVPLLIS